MSNAKEVRADRQYTREHEWAKSEGAETLVGISAFAVDQLGDITLLDLSVKVGDVLSAHQAFGTIESVKTLSDLYSPIAGRVTRLNEELVNHPEWVNEDPWDKSWMIALAPEGAGELLSPADYAVLVEESDR